MREAISGRILELVEPGSAHYYHGMDREKRAPRNRTLSLSPAEREQFRARLMRLGDTVAVEAVLNKTICQDALEAIPSLPRNFVDLLFVDPPYNISKGWNTVKFKRLSQRKYTEWIDSWLARLLPVLKKTASVYLCGDWGSSAAIYEVARKYLRVRNRITWEREKGRGARSNWKNNSEDIWFCTVSDDYWFDVEAVKLKKRVMAPYTGANGLPKDWEQTEQGRCRLTYPSNIWTDITVPFWSMRENTDHPTQKPEKLLAKIMLASTKENDVVLDPFLGSGTTSVVAKKLGREYVGIEIDETYCCLAEKRLDLADQDPCIQGYLDGVFWERNSIPPNGTCKGIPTKGNGTPLFKGMMNG